MTRIKTKGNTIVIAKTRSKRFPFSAFITGASLLVAGLALIPAFLALNREKPDLYYSYALSHYGAPDGIDAQLFTDFLIQNKIPPHLLSVQIKNAGNAPSKKIKVSVDTPGSVVRYVYTPSQKDNPVWVALPPDKELSFGSGIRKVVQELNDLAPDRMLVFGVGYEGDSQETPEIDVFGDAIEATFLQDIKDLQSWSPYRVFLVPLYILGGGLLLTLLWIIGSVVYSNPEYQRLLRDVGLTVVKSFIYSLPGLRIFVRHYDNIRKEQRPGTEQEDGS